MIIPMKRNRTDLGGRGEAYGKAFLKRKGYRILEENYRTSIGEIDIIARDGDTVVFVEVKTRESGRFGRPFEAVDLRKQRKISGAALLYLKQFRSVPPCRFDVVSVYEGKSGLKAELIRDAFEAVME